MDICIYGAGSIGGYLAGRLALLEEHSVSVIARGTHLTAIQQDGLKLADADGCRIVHFAHADDRPERLPKQDIVFVTLKAHSLPEAARDIAGLLKPDGYVVFVTNGLPWWWEHGVRASIDDNKVARMDGPLHEWIGPARSLGCVVYSINEVTAPGTVVHRGNNRWILGEPNDEMTARLENTAALMREAGLNAEAETDIRLHVWKKLLRNAPFNSLCALTRLNADEFGNVPELVRIAQVMTDEVVAIAGAKGWVLPAARAADVVASGGTIGGSPAGGRASMLQDALAGRPLEVEAILGRLQQFAREAQVQTPMLDVVYALTRGLDLSIRNERH
jgi:2-dehydropantoate 2-reductase